MQATENRKGNVSEFLNSELPAQIREASRGAIRTSVEFVRKYPVQTAVGGLALGYFAGLMSARFRK